MPAWIKNLAGKFIVFDGPDGSGKTTQFRRLAAACQDDGVVTCTVREPGGTDVGEKIRDILLDPRNHGMSVSCEMMLYMASRAELVEHVIRPALGRREFVLADRFISSTLAYQGTAGGLDRDTIMGVGRAAVGDCWPDLTVIFDVDEVAAAARVGPDKDRMEQKGDDFHRRVRQGYLDQASADPDHYLVLDASGTEDEVWALLGEGLARRIETGS